MKTLSRILGLSAALSIAAACAGSRARGPEDRAAPPPKPADPGAEGAFLAPARYLFTDRLGVRFDEAGAGATLPGPEPAIVDGVRFLVDDGIAVSTAPAVERLAGFRSLPPRLGGGYVIWSDARVYRAESFLGDLKPIADVGASGGVRPFMTTFLIRTDVGVLEVDPSSLAVNRFGAAGLAEALAVDARRAVRIDALGRATVTADGGKTWIDVLAAKGAPISAARETPEGDLLLSGPGPSSSIRLSRAGDLDRPEDPARSSPPPGEGRTTIPILTAFPASRRSLPGEILAQAVVGGSFLPSPPIAAPAIAARDAGLPAPSPPGRFLVARENGLRLFSGATALPIADADLLGVDEKFGRCAPAALSDGTVLALCAQDSGGEVLDLGGALSQPRLEVTFREAGVYVTGPHGRVGFTGACGPQPASGSDLGPGTPHASEMIEDEPRSTAMPADPPPPDTPALPDLPPADDARFCLRRSADHWIERRLRGDDARHLYRWVPGDDGRVTALVLGHDGEPTKDRGKGDKADAAIPAGSIAGEGVRVIHLDPEDAALKGGAFPAVPAAEKDPPYRASSADFWQDDDGAIRGWIRLPAEGEPGTIVDPTAQGPSARLLRVQAKRGGRAAGVRIDEAGHVTVFALPEGTAEVVNGGRFGLAMALKDDVASYFETTDGGRTWTPVEGPPVGRIEAPFDEGALFGCSAIGCTWGTGIVRLGWGGPRPKPPSSPAADPTFTAAANSLPRGPKPIAISCRVDADAEPWEGAPRSPPRPRTSIPSPSVIPKAPPPPSPRRPPSKAAPGAGKKDPRPLPKASNLPKLPISLSLPAGDGIGWLNDHAWTGDVWLPLDPEAAQKHLSVTDRALNATLGSVIPVLDASPRAPLDLLLAMDRRRLRVGSPGSSFLPFDVQSKITVAADGPEGLLIALDADKGVVWISRGEATSTAIRVTRVPDVGRTRITLARRLDRRGVSLVGYSTATGEVFVGEIDLGRAEIGPLATLGRIESILPIESGACAGQRASHRFLADVPVALSIQGKGDLRLFDGRVTAAMLLEASADRLCASGLEIAVPRGGATDLAVKFGKGGGVAAIRTSAKAVRGSCAIAPEK